LPNRIDAAFGTGLTVALSTTLRRHARYAGGGQAVNSIE